MDETIEQRVKKTIADELGVLVCNVENTSTLTGEGNDLGGDSLDFVEMVMALEEEFETEVPDADAEKWKTVQQVIDYFAPKVAA